MVKNMINELIIKGVKRTDLNMMCLIYAIRAKNRWKNFILNKEADKYIADMVEKNQNNKFSKISSVEKTGWLKITDKTNNLLG